jgi:hypothetical protein
MTATPVTQDDATVCATVDERIGGPGGIWLEQDAAEEPEPPVCSAASGATAFETPVELTLSCTGTGNTLSVSQAPGKGTLGEIDQETGKVTYTPNAGASGTDTFTFKAVNADGTSADATATIAVAAKPTPKPGTPPVGGNPPVKKPGVKRKCPRTKKLKRGKCVKKKVKKKKRKGKKKAASRG